MLTGAYRYLVLRCGTVPSSDDYADTFVDRCQLRAALTQGLEARVTVQWGRRLDRYEEPQDGGPVVVHFKDGSSARFDVLVGADGAQSVVRKQRCPTLQYAELPYTGIAGVVPLGMWVGIAAFLAVSYDSQRTRGSSLQLLRPRAKHSCCSLAERVPAAVRRLYDELGFVRLLGDDGHSIMTFPYRETPLPLSAGGAAYSSSNSSAGGREWSIWSLSYPGQMSEWRTQFAAPGEASHAAASLCWLGTLQ